SATRPTPRTYRKVVCWPPKGACAKSSKGDEDRTANGSAVSAEPATRARPERSASCTGTGTRLPPDAIAGERIARGAGPDGHNQTWPARVRANRCGREKAGKHRR